MTKVFSFINYNARLVSVSLCVQFICFFLNLVKYCNIALCVPVHTAYTIRARIHIELFDRLFRVLLEFGERMRSGVRVAQSHNKWPLGTYLCSSIIRVLKSKTENKTQKKNMIDFDDRFVLMHCTRITRPLFRFVIIQASVYKVLGICELFFLFFFFWV